MALLCREPREAYLGISDLWQGVTIDEIPLHVLTSFVFLKVKGRGSVIETLP